MRRMLGTAVVMVVVLTVLTGLAYPLSLTGIATAAFPGQADGSLITGAGGTVVGSSLIGQSFVDRHGHPMPRYFQPRPSAAGSTGYDAMASGGSNLGPTNPALLTTISTLVRSYRSFNRVPTGVPIPSDAVTTSGSGLDPDISIANARLQAARVATARHIPVGEVFHVIRQATTGRVLDVMGQPGVNVLEANVLLDRLDR